MQKTNSKKSQTKTANNNVVTIETCNHVMNLSFHLIIYYIERTKLNL